MKKLLSIFCLSLILFSNFYCSGDSSNSNQNALLLLLLLANNNQSSASCPESNDLPDGVFLADTVTSAPAHTGTGFKDRQKSINGICGGGNTGGGIDVFSLNSTGGGATLVLEWSSRRIINGAGIDFTVFENPFYINGNTNTRFMDLIVAEVSIDNVNYCGFSPDYTNAPETSYTNNPALWLNFAGKNPVLLNQSTNMLSALDIFDNSKSGGDSFDLSNLSDANIFGNGCTTIIRNNIQSTGFVYLRLRSATSLNNPDTGAAFVSETISDGADIDGVIARYSTAR